MNGPPPPEEELHRMLADPAVWEDPPSGLERRVLGAVLASAPPSPPPATPGDRGVAAGARRRRSPGDRPAWGRVVAVAAGVVLLAGAAFGTGWALRGGDDDGADGDRLRPARAEVALAGAELAPGLTAVLEVEDREGGTGIWLDEPALPPAPEGAVYELWLWRDGQPVSAGTFRGGGPVVLWAGVGLDEYPGVSITLEPLDGDPSPSGRTLLASAG